MPEAKGKKLGNPRGGYIDKERANELRKVGWGQVGIAREFGGWGGRVNKWVHTEYLTKDK